MSNTQQDSDPAPDSKLPGAADESIPRLPPAVKDVKTSRRLLFTLRHFHLGDPGALAQLEPLGADVLPALLDPFRDTSRLRYTYPLFLFPVQGQDGHTKADRLASPLADWLQQAVAAFAPERDGARILKDHLPWIDHHLRETLANVEGPVDAASQLQEAGAALQAHLDLEPRARERLDADIRSLLEQAPPGASVMAYGRYPAMHLLVHAIRSRAVPRRARFQSLIANCIRGLEELLDVEWIKSDESIEPARARDSVGPGNELFDVAALSEVMDHSRGTRQMPAERRVRIKQALDVLKGWEDDRVLVHFIHDGRLDWLHAEGGVTDMQDVVDKGPCGRATELFDAHAVRLAEIFAAVRIAQLEINGIYDPAIHDPWFAKFNWEGFSQDELLLVPTVIAVGDAQWLASEGMHDFSRLLSSGRPIQILVRVQPSLNPSAVDENAFHHYRLELGYLGISHRQTVVTQSSAARHQHLLEGFLAALDATRTGLHVLNTGMRPGTKLVLLSGWLVAGAALEGRAHPFFHVNPGAGDYSAARVNFADNPQPERDWPIQPFAYIDEDGNRVDEELAFTFADYCLLVDRLRDHYRLIPAGFESDALVPMQDYLAMKPDDAYQRVPFVWGVDGSGQLHRLVVSRELALACLDRLNFWHALQELAGVRNRYVEQAIQRTQEEEQEAARQERERLAAEHATELERVRNEAAGEAMQRLTDLLLGMDFMSPGTPMPTQQGTLSTPEAVSAEEPDPGPEPEEGAEPDEELAFDDPWIDTPLCTSCNDCLKINPLLFVYNDEKQALLGDLGKADATYAQMVQAAELCPARCIHPGRPWNPDEAGLEDLIERAAPFNL